MHTDNGFAPLSYMCAFDFRTSPTGDVFFESDIWQVKVEAIVQLSVPKTSDGFSLTTNMTHFRTPLPGRCPFFSAPSRGR
jgi:hypothetical protein